MYLGKRLKLKRTKRRKKGEVKGPWAKRARIDQCGLRFWASLLNDDVCRNLRRPGPITLEKLELFSGYRDMPGYESLAMVQDTADNA